MATFLVMQQELADRTNLDQTVSAYATRLKRALNLTIQDIASRRDWKFLQEREIVQTVADYTTGTVDVTNASATVTGTGTVFATSHVRSFIQFQGETNWYEITARASGTSITISPAFGGTTATGQTFTIRQVFYSLTTSASRILDIRQSATPAKLTNIGYRNLDLYQPDVSTTGAPSAYALFRNDPAVAATAAKKRQLQFFPTPDGVYNMEVRYLKQLSDLSADTDISDLPQQFHTIVIDGAEWMISKSLNDPSEPQKKQSYEFGLQKMIEEENAFDDYQPVLQPSDANRPTRFLPFPTNFSQPE